MYIELLNNLLEARYGTMEKSAGMAQVRQALKWGQQYMRRHRGVRELAGSRMLDMSDRMWYPMNENAMAYQINSLTYKKLHDAAVRAMGKEDLPATGRHSLEGIRNRFKKAYTRYSVQPKQIGKYFNEDLNREQREALMLGWGNHSPAKDQPGYNVFDPIDLKKLKEMYY